MKFLKIIAAVALTSLIVIMVNNLFGLIFPAAEQSETEWNKQEQTCGNLRPTDSNAQPTAYKAYDACAAKITKEFNDQRALQKQWALLRAVAALAILVAIAAMVSRKYPFLAGGLIMSGVVVVMIYPYLVSNSIFGYMEELSEGIRQQVQLVKFITSLLGVAILSIGDLFFFEKNAK